MRLTQKFARWLLIGLSVISRSFGQSPPVAWTGPISSGFQFNYYSGFALDGNDNLLFTGSFASQTLQVGDTILTNRNPAFGYENGQNGFVAKYAKTGTALWARQIGGTRFDVPGAVATDGAGNVLVTGSFESTNLLIGTNVLTNADLTGLSLDFYLVKYDPQGNELWAREASGFWNDWGNAVAADRQGNVFVAGGFNSSNLDFGSNIIINPDTSETNPVYQDFLAKYSPDGDLLWVRELTLDRGGQTFPSIAVDSNGSCYLSDEFRKVVTAGTFAVTNSGGSNSDSAFLAKYDQNGNAVWAFETAYTGSNGELLPHSLAVDPQGECLLAGTYYQATAIFSNIVLPTANGYGSGFVVKYDTSGNLLWANELTNQWVGTVNLDAIGNVYLVTAATTSKYAGSGALLWTTSSLGINGLPMGAVDPAGSLFLAGSTGGLYYAGQFSGPTLNVQPFGSQVIISWPTNEAGLSLETAASLSATNWSPVTNVPVPNGNQFVVTNNILGNGGFYRLRNF